MTGDLRGPQPLKGSRGSFQKASAGRLYLGVLDLEVGRGRRQELQRGHERGGVGLHLPRHGDLAGSHGRPRVGVRGALRGRGALAVYRQVSSGGRFLLDVRPTGAGGRTMRTFAYGRARRPARSSPRPTLPRARLGGLDGRSAATEGPRWPMAVPASRSAGRRGGEAPRAAAPPSPAPCLPLALLLPPGVPSSPRELSLSLPRGARGAWPPGGVIDAPHTPKENLLEPPTPRWPPPGFSAQLLPSAGPAA